MVAELTTAFYLAVFFGIIIGFTHYHSHWIDKYKRYKKEIISLAAGISLTYLLLFLLPELYKGITQLQQFVFLFVLFGAISFHLIEKYIYQHARKRELIEELSVSHALSFFIYHFIVGIVMFKLLEINVISGALFFLPIVFYTAVGQVSLKEIHSKVTEKKLVKIVLSASTLIGILEGAFLLVPLSVFYALLGFVAGAMLYHVMRESIPSEKEGHPIFFLIGAIIYTILILFIWSVI